MLEYDVVDVFAESPFAGNQLAVVHGAEGLADPQLLALAREFNYTETTFPTVLDRGRYRVRIFSPDGEIPFGGHPTLGTAWVLREHGLLDDGAVVQECGAGEIAVTFAADVAELAAAPRDLIGPLDADTVAAVLAAVGLGPADLAGEVWLAGTGLTFVHVPVVEAAVARARATPAMPALPATGDPIGGIDVYAVRPGDTAEVHARVFVPELAVPEDPATGSSAAGLGVALHARGLLAGGDFYAISQGAEVGRPSRLLCRIEATDVVTAVRVAGRVQPIARGRIREP